MLTRRRFLKAVAITGAATTFSGTVPGISAFAATPARIRRSVNNMALNDPDLATYRDFVGLMQLRPQTQKVSWLGFANQHGDENDFKYCPHGDWYFLPWHRGYMDMYEKAAMTLMKNPAFAMPYWDWTTLRELPAAFTSKTYKGKPNPLYVPGRGDNPSMVRNALTGPNALTDKLVGPGVLKNIYKETVFEAFGTSRNPAQNNLDPKWVPMGGGVQGILEATPHNNVHNNIGAFMPQSNSPRDPIFMMHHGNIDRIWANWTALGRQNSSDSLWLNMPFTNNYIAPDGTFYTKVVKDLQSTTALGYTYENLPKPDHLVPSLRRQQNMVALFDAKVNGVAKRIKKINKLAAKINAQLSMPFTLESSLLDSVIATHEEKTPGQEMVAIISNIEMGDNVRAIRVFINSETVTQDVPDTDPHFVTTISFLRHKGDHHQSLPSAMVNLTETLVNLRQAKQLSGDTITVQLLPVPEPGAAVESVGKVIPASIEIAVI
jgi:tyrosinase